MDADGGCGCAGESAWFAVIVSVLALCAAAALVIWYWPTALLAAAFFVALLVFLYLFVKGA